MEKRRKHGKSTPGLNNLCQERTCVTSTHILLMRNDKALLRCKGQDNVLSKCFKTSSVLVEAWSRAHYELKRIASCVSLVLIPAAAVQGTLFLKPWMYMYISTSMHMSA